MQVKEPMRRLVTGFLAASMALSLFPFGSVLITQVLHPVQIHRSREEGGILLKGQSVLSAQILQVGHIGGNLAPDLLRSLVLMLSSPPRIWLTARSPCLWC